MSTIAVVHRPIARGVFRGEWPAGIASGDVGIGFGAPMHPIKTVEASGTFSSTSIAIEGSNDSTDGVDGTWEPLHVAGTGAALAFTTAGAQRIAENPLWVRPNATGGSGSGLTVTILAATHGYLA